MSKFKVHDQVNVLNDTLTGEVIKIQGERVIIEDADGFERNYSEHQLVLNTRQSYFSGSRSEEIEIKDNLYIESQIVSKKHAQKSKIIPQIDLHIEQLLDRHLHLTNVEIVMKQMSATKEFIQKLIRDNSAKGIIIHGVGAGALRSDIQYYLDGLIAESKEVKEYNNINPDKHGRSGAIEVVLKR